MPDIPLPKPAAPVTPPDEQTSATPGVSPVNQQVPQVAPTPLNSPLPSDPPPPPQVQPGLPAEPPKSPSGVALPPASVGALSSLSSNALPKVGAPVAGKTPTLTPPASPTLPPQKGGAPVPPPASPQFATKRSPLLKFLPWIVGALVLLVVGVLVVPRLLTPQETTTPAPSTQSGKPDAATPPTQAATLEYWGLWEPQEVMEEVLKDFERENPGVQVRYTKQSHRDYRERLQTAIASGNGPDVFRFHATWATMLKNELAPLPNSTYTTAEFQELFYPVVVKQLQVDGQIVGVPLMYDGLALLYNKKILETAGLQPPKTWVELRSAAKTLTLLNGNTVERGGVALGSAKNVDHFSDIIGFLLLQNGADLKKPNSQETKDALAFYTNFLKSDNVWSETLPSSTVAFAREDVAMIFAPSWRIHEILATNPNISFGVAPLPKLATEQIGWANYWAEGVNSKGKNKQAAWNLLKYLSSAEVQQKLYSNQSKVRSFGEIYSRKDLASSLAGAPYVEAYLQDAPFAQSWYLTSNTFDKGIDDQLIKYYEDAITATLEGKTTDSTLQTLELGTTQVLRQYNATGSN